MVETQDESSLYAEVDLHEECPTTDFLISRLNVLTFAPRPKLGVVFDIDETLIYASRRQCPCDFQVTLEGQNYYVVKRPYLTELLQFCFSNYEVFFFTSATEPDARAILAVIAPGQTHRLFHRADTDEIGGNVFKDLRRIHWPIDRLILIDNSPSCNGEQGYCLRAVPFTGDPNDDFLQTLCRDYLPGIDKAFTVREWINTHWEIYCANDLDRSGTDPESDDGAHFLRCT
jgi:hypothetical protein